MVEYKKTSELDEHDALIGGEWVKVSVPLGGGGYASKKFSPGGMMAAPESPLDNKTYARKDGTWHQIAGIEQFYAHPAAAFQAGDKAKLDAIQEGATANSTDAHLLNRANHTGSQTTSSISNCNILFI